MGREEVETRNAGVQQVGLSLVSVNDIRRPAACVHRDQCPLRTMICLLAGFTVGPQLSASLRCRKAEPRRDSGTELGIYQLTVLLNADDVNGKFPPEQPN